MALRLLGNGTSTDGVFNIDQFYYEKYFWRENVGKTALEHTMFTTLEVLNNLIAEQKFEWFLRDCHYSAAMRLILRNIRLQKIFQ